MSITEKALILNGQRRHGFEDGKNGKKPSFWRTSLIESVGSHAGEEESERAREYVSAYEEAYRQGQQARRNEELSK